MRIGDKGLSIWSGSFNIKTEEDLKKFMNLYYKKVFINREPEYLVEKQDIENGGPILVDLDFRFPLEKKVRQHDKRFIKSLIKCYASVINSMFDIKREISIPVYIFERKKAYVDKNKQILKDGIHLVIGIHCDHIIQTMIRNNIMKKTKKLFETLPLLNTLDEVFDDGISNGITPWQIFGSRKPGKEPYNFTNMWEIQKYNNDNNNRLVTKIVQIKDAKREKIDLMEILWKSSSQYKGYDKFCISQANVAEYEDRKKDKNKKKSKKKKASMSKNPSKMEQMPTTIEELEMLAQEKIDEQLSLSSKNIYLKDVNNYTLALDEKYYNPYNMWMKVGWALYNTNPNLFWTWMLFSAKSPKFNFDSIKENMEIWEKMHKSDEGLTHKSIEYWCRHDNPEKYEEIRQEGIQKYIQNTLSMFGNLMKGTGITQAGGDEGLDDDLANLTHYVFKNKYVCVACRQNVWYKFENHRWVLNDEGVDIYNTLSEDVHHLFILKIQELKKEYLSHKDDDNVGGDKQKDKLAILSKRICAVSKVSQKLRKRSGKRDIFEELKRKFYNNQLVNKLDRNPNLLCFNNGILDLKKMEFRNGYPEDYVSLTTGLDYIPFDEKNKEHIRIKGEIDDFMEKLFPNPELRNYMWEHSASTLSGLNINQKFIIYTGKGANGKSRFVNLINKALGEYSDTLDIGVVTHKRSGPGRPMPEITKLPGKRYICMDESTKGDVLNEGIIKQFTGGDKVEARGMFSKQMTQFTPQFEFVHTTNNMPEIKTRDDGTWRRVRQVPFLSKFVDEHKVPPNNIDPLTGNKHYIKDTTIDDKIETWKTVFVSLLVDIFKKTKGKVRDCDIVMQATNEYRYKQDVLGNFIRDMLENTGNPNDKLTKKVVYKEFEEWYRIDHADNPPKSSDLYDAITNDLGIKWRNRCWQGIRIKINDDSEDDDDDEYD